MNFSVLIGFAVYCLVYFCFFFLFGWQIVDYVSMIRLGLEDRGLAKP